MTNQDIPHATIAKDGTHLTIVDAASHAARLSLDIDTLIIERYALQALYIILTEMAYHTIGSADRHRQATTVGLKSAIQHTVYRAQGRSLLRLLLGSGYLTRIALLISFRLQFGSLAISLSLLGSLFRSGLAGCLFRSGTLGSLGSSTGTSLLLGFSLCLSLGSGFGLRLTGSLLCQSCLFGSLAARSFGGSLTSLCLGYTAGILSGGSSAAAFLRANSAARFLAAAAAAALRRASAAARARALATSWAISRSIWH